jgi:putative CocE/NonD family hydrolase
MGAWGPDVREIENLLIPMPDGVRLAARVFLPTDAEHRPVPAILECIPYGKRFGTWERDELTHPLYSARGYAALRVDLRGSGDSEGILEGEYTQQEHDDIVQAIGFVSRQPWCNGAVGLMGISWGGFNALQVAARRPPALKAIISLCASDDRYTDDAHFMGGAVLLENVMWNAALMISACQPPDPVLVGDAWRTMWLQRLHGVRPFITEWLSHPTRDAYWRHGSVSCDPGAIACPVYLIGGWTDAYRNAVPRLLATLRVPRQGLIGPWAHRYPHIGRPGPAMDFVRDSLRWWDRWLKGKSTAEAPLLRAWMMESVLPASSHAARPGRWIAEAVWPPSDQQERRLFLNEAGLRPEAGRAEPRTLRSPASTGMLAGSWCPFARSADDADDQRSDDERSLVFDSVPLDAPMEVLGSPELHLRLCADRPVATLAVRLCAVHPGGESLRVTYGIVDLTHRDGHDLPAALEPDEIYDVSIPLNAIGFVFPRGHVMRVAISTAYWPIVWPEAEPATVTILTGESFLVLPERRPPAEDSAADPGLGQEPIAMDRAVPLVAGGVRREFGQDAASGEAYYRIIQEPSVNRIPGIGADIGNAGVSEFHIRDNEPAAARVRVTREHSVRRGDWSVRVELETVLSQDQGAFHMKAQLRAWENGSPVCDRRWHDTIDPSGRVQR